MKNPNVELVFFGPPPFETLQLGNVDELLEKFFTLGKEMRVAGVVEFLDDHAMLEQLLKDQRFLKKHEKFTVIFRIPHGEAWFWTWGNYGEESLIPHIHF